MMKPLHFPHLTPLSQGKLKFVDKRMKADRRAMKAQEKRGKKRKR
jgi:hypothetical protein